MKDAFRNRSSGWKILEEISFRFRSACNTPAVGRLSKFVKRLVDHCPNLVSINVTNNVWSNTHQYFAQMLHDVDRASKLRELTSDSWVDPDRLMIIFESCTNLETIDFRPTLQDHHLIEWAGRGGGLKLRKLRLRGCENISDDGLIPIIVNAGERLIRFDMFDMFNDPNDTRITNRTWRMLFDHCPFLNYAYNMPEEMKPLAREKCILNKSWWFYWHGLIFLAVMYDD